MTTSTSIFITYKKILLSHDSQGQTIQTINSKAEILNEILQNEPNYKPWIDDSQLPAGIEWEKTIYKNLLLSDVVIALISKGTSDSEWVRRELALAQALGISILPLGFDIDDHDMKTEVEQLGIGRLQFTVSKNISLRNKKPLLEELRTPLLLATAETHEKQHHLFRELIAARTQRKTPAKSNQRAWSFVHGEGAQTCKIHLATGDISDFKEIDVLVNSENNFMQMARVFERRTVSSLLRQLGSRIVRGVTEDTIQKELDWQLKDYRRPVDPAEVFITSAGAPDSLLVKDLKAQYIFHVAAVEAVVSENRVVPFQQSYQVKECVRNCLRKIGELRSLGGLISPPDTDQRRFQEERSKGEFKVRSVLFPLFGTGQGGKEPKEVIPWMLNGITDFWSNDDNADVRRDLEDIYVSVFFEEDIDTVRQALKAQGLAEARS